MEEVKQEVCVCVPVEEMEQLNTLFLQKQQELLLAVARVDELNHQLEVLRSNRIDLFPPPPSHHYHHQMSSSSSSRAELERLCKELQVHFTRLPLIH